MQYFAEHLNLVDETLIVKKMLFLLGPAKRWFTGDNGEFDKGPWMK